MPPRLVVAVVALVAMAVAGFPTGVWGKVGDRYLGVSGGDRAAAAPTTGSPAPTAGGWSASALPPTATPPSGPSGSGPPQAPARTREEDRAGVARQVLDRRAAAVADGDKAAWMATVDDPGSAFGKDQSRTFDNMMLLRLSRFGYDHLDIRRGAAPARARALDPSAWLAKVEGSFALAGFDRGPRTFTATYTFVRRAGQWRVGADTDGPTSHQLWDMVGLRVIRTDNSLVVGNAPADRMRFYSGEAQSGIARVSAVWGRDWARRAVLVTPATTAEFAQLLGRASDGGLRQVAAVTQGPLAAGDTARADAVVVNPAAFQLLEPVGRRVVITHELTHVAVRSSTTQAVPLWLSEGMADYVGYRGVGLPPAQVAAELLQLVRRGDGPRGLPTERDYDPTRTTIAPTYSASWLACVRLAELYGQAKLVAFYRAVAGSAGRDPDDAAAAAFPRAFGVSQSSFVAGWRTYLARLARA